MLLLSHGGSTIYTPRLASDRMLVGTIDGVFGLERDGQNGSWRPSLHSLEGLHVHALVEEPAQGRVFAGTLAGGIFVSTDEGHTWEARNDGLSQKDVYSLTWAKSGNVVRLFAGTEPAHLFVSEDYGEHWTELPGLRQVNSVPKWTFPGPPHIAHAKHISFAPDDPDVIYVSIEQGALLKSADGGKTWSELGEIFEDVHRVIVNPHDSSRLIVSSGAGLYASKDGGKTLDRLTTRGHEIGGYPDQLVIEPRNPDTIYVAAASSGPSTWRWYGAARSRLSRSEDGGMTWQVLNGPDPYMVASVEALSLEQTDTGVRLFIGTTSGEIFSSVDRGEHWELVAKLAPISKGEGHYLSLESNQAMAALF